MLDSEERDVIWHAVWSGFHDDEDIADLIDDLLIDEPTLDAEALWAFARAEQQRKIAAAASWPEQTDCDRLDAAFDALKGARVLGLHNAGYTRADGHVEANEAMAQLPDGAVDGYCFYHGQDVERVLADRLLLIAFDHVEGDDGDRAGIANRVMAALRDAGLNPEWSGDVNRCIEIPDFDWKRR